MGVGQVGKIQVSSLDRIRFRVAKKRDRQDSAF